MDILFLENLLLKKMCISPKNFKNNVSKSTTK